jgi:hypothetical protein
VFVIFDIQKYFEVLSVIKTKTFDLKARELLICKIALNSNSVKQVREFKYLGDIISLGNGKILGNKKKKSNIYMCK